MTPADRENLLDLLMAMEAHGVEPDNLGDLVDWLARRRAEAARDQHEASVRLMELGGWWQLVRRQYAELGGGAPLATLLELIDDEARP